MAVSVREALALPVLAAGDPVVLSGERGLDARIRWVHVSEVRDVGAVLVGDELVLSTGIGMAASPAAAEDFVRQLVEVGAAGLVVELSAAYPSVPDGALGRARAAGFPLVVLNRPVRFVEVTEQVHRAIVAEQFEEVRFAGEVHRTFSDLGLARASMTRLVEAAADLTGSSVVLEDLARRVLATAARAEPVDRLLTDWERRSRLTPSLRETGTGGPEGWLTTPVGIQGGAWGRLVVTTPREDARARLVAERAAQALELGRMIERDETSIQLRVHAGFLLDLLDGRLGSEAVAAARLRALGVPESTDHVGAVARLRSSDGSVDRLVTALGDVTGLVGVLDADHVGLLVPGAVDLDEVARALAGVEPDAVLAAGHVATGVLPAAASLRSARVVADVAATLPAYDGCVRQADIRLPGLLMSLREDARLQEFAEAELGRLLEHEARHGGGLVDLLRHYLAVGGNKTELARVAHRNRTSLYPALKRLEELVGHPLDDPTSRLSLGVALLAYDQSHELRGR
ncbi:PucR family transcriptional regulator [Nocardioides sp. MAH-18]|uniref:PucR family transcriptional regulator n=1 Tax=Nocardioides agri TaxID=2682843 RepID=A0A6L6XRP1_9ACTN|nr:PucR family transcriptional regulator [Nocardioides sp. CGMCC 1.13656]MBA2954996.1 PucR family transcriptional regulator [Nocardioides sp. CGMCC 1.13656]MVQ49850.1 PucR family transcriptional regulator [Nocardioides sp. MAH-18]